ncbi:transmembrane protein 80-like isoform X5 [Pristis pectinata]|uniref:transmembrane protein 80-like isoform X5 n=1 Tax=Pristis pectinata TaxID=685728 RepID=UPI00223E450D|nr:transmembrane protein 80-like isoform X5 [Pristis pectinata]
MELLKVNSAAVLSSIPLQMIYNFNIFYYVFYFLATFLMVIYKSFKGNLTEEVVPIVINLVLTIGSMLLSLYYLLWQTYVLKADVIINAILLAIYGLEEVLDVIAVSTFARIYT